MPKRYKTNLIRRRTAYTLEEIAKLLGKGKRTCFRWIEEGLAVVEIDAKPLLIMGYELRRFLEEKEKKNKSPMEKDELFCLHCRKPAKAKLGSEQINPTGKRIGKDNREQMMKTALCEVCGGKMYRLC